jgi:uncharacterized integral membrane protein (TIGR00697 family)
LLTTTEKQLAYKIYLVLAAVFIASMVISNLIFQKFFYWDAFGLYTFKLSVGILPYPITFLITDMISEVYGEKKANQVVTAGIFASVFSLGIIYISAALPAVDSSPVNDQLFKTVFGQTALAVMASMIAYLLAQYIDIYIYHFWKKVTNGKMLWVRNNFSTFTSQTVDTLSVLLLLCFFEIIPWSLFQELFISGLLFKIIIAVLDTPFLYLFVHLFNKKFKLNLGQEINLD